MEKKRFQDIDTGDFKTQRDNPYMNEKEEVKEKPAQQNYATIRIYPNDHKLLKDLAYFQSRKMVEIVNDSVNIYNKFYKVANDLGISTDTAIEMALEQLKKK